MGNLESRGSILGDPFEASTRRQQQAFLNYFNSNSSSATTALYPANTNQVYFNSDRSRLFRDLTRDPSSTLGDIYEYIAYRCGKNLDFNPNKTNVSTKLNNLIIKSYERKLLDILKCKHSQNETIFGKIMLKFNQYEVNSYEFIRALVTAFCESCLDSAHRFDLNLFRNRIKILSLFIYQNENLELQALYAIQDFSSEVMPQQPDLLFILYDLFYENDIISERVFMSTLDPNELNYMLRHSRKHSEKLNKLINESMTNNLVQFQNSFANSSSNYSAASLQPTLIPSSNQIAYQYSSLEPNMINNIYSEQSNHSDFIYDANNSVSPNWFQSDFSSPSNNETTIEPSNSSSSSSNSNSNATTNNATSQREKEPECPVCMETFSELKRDKKPLMSTTCGHIMCKSCTDNLFRISSKRALKKKFIECPVCRKSIDSNGVHGIYI